jgi:hypothetical protein
MAVEEAAGAEDVEDPIDVDMIVGAADELDDWGLPGGLPGVLGGQSGKPAVSGEST